MYDNVLLHRSHLDWNACYICVPANQTAGHSLQRFGSRHYFWGTGELSAGKYVNPHTSGIQNFVVCGVEKDWEGKGSVRTVAISKLQALRHHFVIITKTRA